MYERLLSDYQLIENTQAASRRRVRGVDVVDADPDAIAEIVAAGGVALPVDRRLGADARRDVEARAARVASFPAGAAVIVLSSGTGGRSRGVVLTHENLRTSAVAVCTRLAVGAADTWLVPLSPAHVAGLAPLWRAAVSGCAVRFVDAGADDALAAALRAGEATLVSLVPTQLRRLVRAGVEPRNLRVALVGGGPVDADLVAAARALGYPVRTSYGMTEMASTVAIDAEVLDGVIVRIVDGEIAVGGSALSAGDIWAPAPRRYVGDLLLTGDAGRLEDGKIIVEGRRDTVVIVGGENVDLADVELALHAHPRVERARAFGVADPEYGEAVHADVVASGVEPDALVAHCRRRLPGVAVPHAIRLVDDIPTTLLGEPRRG